MELHFGGKRLLKVARKLKTTKLLLYLFVSRFHEGYRGFFSRNKKWKVN